MTEFVLTNLVFPLGQAVLYDLSKKALSNNKTKKKMQDAIKRGVSSAFKRKSPEIADSIFITILNLCESHEKADIQNIVKREFEQWGEQNLNPVEIATEIDNNIAANILADPELCNAFSANIIYDLFKQFQEFQKSVHREYDDLRGSINTILQSNHQSLFLLHQIADYNQDTTVNYRKALENSKFIPDSYKNHFLRPLFLERTLSDGNVATLKDVYIQNSFSILDFPFHNEGLIYTNLLEFIVNFINNNLLESNYHTRFSSSSTAKALRTLIIQGHPGSGKSSLFYYLAYLKCYTETFFPNYNFYFIKLIEIYNKNNGILSITDPFHDIIEFINSENPFYGKCVLVLDGLDEICVAKNFDADEYCQNLIRQAITYQNLKIIITTRLNYISISNKDNRNVINIQLQNLSFNDLKCWLNNYFTIHPLLTDLKKTADHNIKLLERKAEENISDIFAIPLLFYMIVTSGTDISKIKSIGQLYDSVFQELRERNYNPNEDDFLQKHVINNRISDNLARQIVIEISYEMYIKNVLLLKYNDDLDEIRRALNNAYRSDRRLKPSDKEQIEILFPITFFFKNSTDVVEFAHKSIMEFFSAEKMYQLLISHDGPISAFITKHLYNPIISNEVASFLQYFVESRQCQIELRNKYINVLNEFIDRISTKTSHFNQRNYPSIETQKYEFKVCWFLIRNILNISPSNINAFLENEYVKEYILGAVSIRNNGNIPFLNENATRLSCADLSFLQYHFSYCSLAYVLFHNTEFKNCSFSFSNLQSIELVNVCINGEMSFNECNLDNAKLIHFKYKNCKRKISFSGCSLKNAVFCNVDITRMSFEGMICSNVSFSDVIMSVNQFNFFSNHFSVFNSIKIRVVKSDFSEADLIELSSVSGEKKKHMIIEKIQLKTKYPLLDNTLIVDL